MKKFTKLFLSCAAVAAVTAAVATSAMAAENAIPKENLVYDASTGTLTITAPEGYADANAIQTMIVLGPGVGEDKADKTNIKAENILGIDQSNAITTAKLDKDKIDAENKQYIVMLGGTSGDVYVGTFGAGGVLIGDVDLNEDIDLDDATEVVKHAVKISTLTGDALVAADTDFNDDVDLDDATCIVKYAVKLS